MSAATIGHNTPKPLTPEEVNAYLAETCRDLIARRDEILAGVTRFHEKFPEIDSDDTQGKAGDFAGGKGAMAGFLTVTEGRRKAEKVPFDAAGAAVQAFFRAISDPVTAARKTVNAKMDAYADRQEAKRREDARIAAEAAARIAREAEALALKTMNSSTLEMASTAAKAAETAEAHANAGAAELTRTTGIQTTVSVHTRWTFDEAESDLAKLVAAAVTNPELLRYLQFNSVRIGVAVRSEGVRSIPGCEIKEVRSVR